MQARQGLAGSPRCGVDWKWRGAGNVVSLVVRRGRLREEFANGHTYYALEGQPLRLPKRPDATHDQALLAWHSETVFQAT
jgi:hypothetical protein